MRKLKWKRLRGSLCYAMHGHAGENSQWGAERMYCTVLRTHKLLAVAQNILRDRDHEVLPSPQPVYPFYLTLPWFRRHDVSDVTFTGFALFWTPHRDCEVALSNDIKIDFWKTFVAFPLANEICGSNHVVFITWCYPCVLQPNYQALRMQSLASTWQRFVQNRHSGNLFTTSGSHAESFALRSSIMSFVPVI